MSGHSKWATTKRAKFASDAKKASIFTKLSRVITMAAKEKGSDPETNFSLRLGIEKAKAANMPKENIDRAIKRGTGELEGATIEEIVYEGFGPGKISVVIKVLTDNRNRASSNIKHIFSKSGGAMAGPNAVTWQFSQKGVIRFDLETLADKNYEELELAIIDLGAEDIKKTSDSVIVYTKVEDLQKITKGLSILGLTAEYANIDYVPKETITLEGEALEKVYKFFEALDEDEDVDDYYTNLTE